MAHPLDPVELYRRQRENQSRETLQEIIDDGDPLKAQMAQNLAKKMGIAVTVEPTTEDRFRNAVRINRR
ncbi:MAG: hypothetical protein HQL90_02790 [Magnetococcales bacterium]|nr:hypothetical protein [Magnetococcales bacterium]